jgi:hypothetical protein
MQQFDMIELERWQIQGKGFHALSVGRRKSLGEKRFGLQLRWLHPLAKRWTA